MLVFLLHARLRAHQAPGIPRALFIERAKRNEHLAQSTRGEIANVCLTVIASAAKQSIYPLAATWIASRSLSSGARSRDPLARNDVVDGPT